MNTFFRVINLLSKPILDFNVSKSLITRVGKSFCSRNSYFIVFLLCCTPFIAYPQVTNSRTYKAGLNAGDPITERAPITEIIDFKVYDDDLASSVLGQPFEISLLSGHTLRFTLKKTGNRFSPSAIPTYPNASMGAVPTYNPPAPSLPALYSVAGPTNATFIFENIGVYKPDGSTAISWNIIIIDAESTNSNPESISTTTDGEVWSAWDLITNTSDNPEQTGTETRTVRWDGRTMGLIGAHAAASVNPRRITSRILGSQQGIALAIQSYIANKTTEICSGFSFDGTPTEIVPSSEMSYTWLDPVVSGNNGVASLSGGNAQNSAVSTISQTLVNNTSSIATATYIVTPHHQSGTDLEPFVLTVNVNPSLQSDIGYTGPFCASGVASVTRIGQNGGTFNSSPGLVINSLTGDIDLQASTPGSYTVFYNLTSGTCSNSSSTQITINALPTVTATASKTIVCAGTPVTLTGIGAFTYVWDNGVSDGLAFVPLTTRTYTVTGTDDKGCTNIASITIIVDPCPPVLINDEFTEPEDEPVTGNVGTNDSDNEGDTLTFSTVTQPANGTLTFNPDGSFTFLPNPGWNGSTSFDYQACDRQGSCKNATVIIIVTPVNDPPIAENDPFTGTEDSTLNGSVAVNDFDPDGDPLIFKLTTEPENGKIIFNPDGSFVFEPNPGWSGTTSFEYQVCDNSGLCTTATVAITVAPVNDAPIAVNDLFEIPAGTIFNGDVSLNDSDPDKDTLTFDFVIKPQHGELIFNDNGTFVYTPESGYFGTDEFTYITCDTSGMCSEATVALTVKPLAIVSLTPSFSRIAEGNKVTITAVLSEPLTEDIEITLAYSGDAQNAIDYILFGNFVTIRIPAGQTSTSQNFVIGSLIDDINEKDEHVLVTISQVSASNVKIGLGADVTIVDMYPPAKEVRDEDEITVNQTIKPDPLISPNGDGQGNDQFMIDNILQFPDNEVLIFNRWGNEVYRINGYDNSGRSFQGIANTGILTNTDKNLPEGVYYYIIYTTDSSNVKRLNKGYLILKR